MTESSMWDSQLASALLGAFVGAALSTGLSDLVAVRRRRRTFARLLRGIIGANLERLAPFRSTAATPREGFVASAEDGHPALLSLPPGALSESYGTLSVDLLLQLGRLDDALWGATSADALAVELEKTRDALLVFERSIYVGRLP